MQRTETRPSSQKSGIINFIKSHPKLAAAYLVACAGIQFMHITALLPEISWLRWILIAFILPSPVVMIALFLQGEIQKYDATNPFDTIKITESNLHFGDKHVAISAIKKAALIKQDDFASFQLPYNLGGATLNFNVNYYDEFKTQMEKALPSVKWIE